MTKARRARIWERDNGICYLCGQPVQLGELWDVEHKTAWALSFDDSDANLAVAHKAGCHEAKTKVDVTTIAKAKAQAGETGQYARRLKRKAEGKAPLIKGRGFEKGPKRAWPKRGLRYTKPE